MSFGLRGAGGASAKNSVGTADTLVKSVLAELVGIAINKPIANATVAFYDGVDATGTLLGTITLPATVTSMPPSTLFLGIACSAGIFVSAVGVGLDITILYR